MTINEPKLREKLFIFFGFMFFIIFVWVNIWGTKSVKLKKLPITNAGLIHNIDKKLKEFCEEFPHNKECYIMTSVINPVPKNPLKVHALTKKDIIKNANR